MTFFDVLQLPLLLGFPAAAYYLCQRFKFFEVLGPVLLCYGFGMLLRNTHLYPINDSISKNTYEIAVLFAIPLMLFSVDFLAWLRLAAKTSLSFGLAIVSVMALAATGTFIFGNGMQDSWAASGMLVGVYTGGTANMAAIGKALDVSEQTYVLLNASDVVISSFYLLFLMTVAKKWLGKFFRPFDADDGHHHEEKEETRSYWHAWGGLLLAAGVVAGSVGIAILVTGKMNAAVIILGLTTLGIGASFLPQVRALAWTFEAGEYIILVFCVAIGTMTDFTQLFDQGGQVFYFCAFVLVGAIILHFVLCYLFKIDVDTMLITSTAAVFSPAFVPVIAEAMKNRAIILSGLTTGLLGFAAGNYMGITLAYLLKP